MLSKNKELVIREIWNARFRSHSLRPLQSSITHARHDLEGITKFFVNHRVLPLPLPETFQTTCCDIRRREFRYKPISLREVLHVQQIKVLTVSKHLPFKEAVIERLKQHDIIVTDIAVDLLNSNKHFYQLTVLKSPFINTKDVAKLVIKTSDESLLATKWMDGLYQSKSNTAHLNVTPYLIDERVHYGSVIAWERHSDVLKIKATAPTSLKLYNAEDNIACYDHQMNLIESTPIFSVLNIEAGTQLDFKFLKDKTLLELNGETTELGIVGNQIACLFYNESIAPEQIMVEISSLEQV